MDVVEEPGREDTGRSDAGPGAIQKVQKNTLVGNSDGIIHTHSPPFGGRGKVDTGKKP
jgi:hypothetical protein